MCRINKYDFYKGKRINTNGFCVAYTSRIVIV